MYPIEIFGPRNSERKLQSPRGRAEEHPTGVFEYFSVVPFLVLADRFSTIFKLMFCPISDNISYAFQLPNSGDNSKQERGSSYGIPAYNVRSRPLENRIDW